MSGVNDQAVASGHVVPVIAPTLCGSGNHTGGDRPPGTTVDTCESLVPIGFYANDSGNDAGMDVCPTLRSMEGGGGNHPAVALPTLEAGARTGHSTDDVRAGIGIGEPGDPMYTLQSGKQHAVGVSLRGRDGGGTAELSGEVATALRASTGGGDKAHALTGMAVRRLTPRECERLQGFQDNYTLIPYRKKPAADGPRYKALGNSWAVPVVAWIGKRIQVVEEML